MNHHTRRMALDHPIWGHWLTFTHDQLDHLEQLAAYGDWVRLRFPPVEAVLIGDPSIAEELLVARNADFVKPMTTQRLSSVMGDGLITSNGESWLRQRRLVQPAFHRERVATYAATMVELTERLTASWADGAELDVHQAMMHLTLEIVAQTLFGSDVSAEADQVSAAIGTALWALGKRVSSIGILTPDLFPTPTNVRLWRARWTLNGIADRLIAARRATRNDRGDLLSTLLYTPFGSDGSMLTDHQVRDEVLTLMLAGHETTALALTWAWYLLSTNPRVEADFQAELDSVLAGRAPTVDDLARLPLTNGVVLESLRLYPPAWLIERGAVRQTTLGGRLVHKHARFLVSPWTMHRDPRWFDRPTAFDPIRWGTAVGRNWSRRGFLPFGGGPRMCVGHTFALTEAALVLASIGRRFSLVLAPGQTIEPVPAITLRPRQGVRVRARLRDRRRAAPERVRA